MFANFKEFNENVESFSNYIKRLEQSFILHDVKEEKKVPAILTLIGAKTYSLLVNLTFPVEPETKSFTEIVDLLCKHLDPTPNKIVQRILFRKAYQKPEESIADFSSRLKKLTTHCEFVENALEENLLEQFLRGLKNEIIQSKLLTQVAELTFKNAVEQAVTLQSAENDILELQNKSLNVNKVLVNKNTKQKYVQNNFARQNNSNIVSKNVNSHVNKGNLKCFRCNSPTHLANVCKYKNSICDFCAKKGHLKKACRNTGAKKKQLNVLETENILSVRSENTKPIKVWVLIENTAKAEMELDTGSGISTVPIARFRRLFPKHKMFPADVQLRTATGEIFRPEGFVKVNVTYENKTKNVKLYLIKEDNFPLLLGRDWINEFNLFANCLNSVSVHTVTTSENLRNILSNYSDLFTNKVGEIKNVKAELHLEKNATPIFCKARTVTYALRNAVNEELERLEKEGILKSVNTSKWATPIVPVVKPNGKIRLCGDFKVTVNKFLKVDKYPLPKIEDILATLGGGTHFTKIDLNQAYLHLPVDEKSQELLTINTPKGLFQFTRLPYGIASSPAKWQRTIENILSGIKGIAVFIDDICISGETEEIHLQRLKQVLDRLREYNLKINKEKSFFMKDEITYCGYKIDKNGIHKTQEKIEAILKAPQPVNVTQVKAFLGLISYYSRFFPNLSTIAYPLNKLLRKNVKFTWTTECERAFNAIKNEIISDRVLTHFNSKLPLVLATDASPYGISAVLSHTMPDNSEKPIAFVSRTLSHAEKRYSQVDKEALSIIFGVKKFFQFLYGRRFTLYTDSKPLVSIFSPSKSIPVLSAARMQRYAIYLQTFQYDIKYKKSVEHGNADALSRLPLRSEDITPSPSDTLSSFDVPLPLNFLIKLSPKFSTYIDEVELFQLNQMSNLPITSKHLAIATKNDLMLKEIYLNLISGTEIPKHLLHGCKQEEFTLQQGVILKGCRVVIPEKFRLQILNDLHFGHFGIVKMKALARSFVWWPGIDCDIEKLVKNCTICVKSKNNPPKETSHHWEWPSTPWQRIHIDYFGPIEGKMLLIVVDAHSKWPEVFIVPNTTSSYTIQCLSSLFARYGYPLSLVSDNGPQFTSDEFKHFLHSHGIKHRLSAPYHPATNGQAERYVQTVKRGLKCLTAEHGTLQEKLNKFLLQYRKMPHITTGESPASLFLKRHIRTNIDLILPNAAEYVQKKQDSGNFKFKKPRKFYIGQKVAVRNYTPEEKWKIGKIIKKLGKLHYEIKVGANIWKRHIDQISEVGTEINLPQDTNNENEDKNISIGKYRDEITTKTSSMLESDLDHSLIPNTPDPVQVDFRAARSSDLAPVNFRSPSLCCPKSADLEPPGTPDLVQSDSTKSNHALPKNSDSTPPSDQTKNSSDFEPPINVTCSFSPQGSRKSTRKRKPPNRLTYNHK